MSFYTLINRALMQTGQIEDISVVVANLDAIAGVINGNIDSTNFAAGQILLPSKLIQEGALDGQVLAWANATTKWQPSSRPPVTVSATPPASPNDGDEWILPADATNGVMWRFKYRVASASAYKWEFIGGAPLAVSGQSGTTTSSTPANLGTGLTVPRLGDYIIRYGAMLTRATPTEWLYVSLDASDGTKTTTPLSWTRTSTSNEQALSFAGMNRINDAAASGLWRLRIYNSNNTSSISASGGFLEITPVRVS